MRSAKSISITTISASYLFIVAALAVFLVVRLCELITRFQIPFDTDEADHATAAVELYFNLWSGKVASILDSITRQGFYPPLNSCLLTLSYILAGPTLISSRIPGVVQYCIYLMIMGVTAQTLAQKLISLKYQRFAWVTVVALCAFSPITIINSGLCMLEPTGLLVSALILYCLIRFDDYPNFVNCALLSIALVLLVLTKYSFGVMVVPAVVVALISTCVHDRRKCFRVFAIIASTMLGITIWLSITDFHSVVHFFIGHRSYAPLLSAENLLFDIHGFLSVYTPNWIVAIFVIIFASDCIFRCQRVPVVRAAALIVLMSLVILGASSTNEHRHFIVASPAIFLLGGVGFSLFLQSSAQYRLRLVWYCGLAAFLFSFSVGVYRLFNSLPRTIKVALEGEAEYNQLQDFIMASLEPNAKVIVNGTDDTFNIQALRWKAAVKIHASYTALRWDEYPSNDEGKALTDLYRNKNVDHAWQDKEFPKAPFSRIVQTGYYHYAVQIKNLLTGGFRTEADREFFEALKDYPSVSKFIDFGRRVRMRVTVYDLRKAGGGAI